MPTEGRGERTRRTMIDSAERLVAERGLAALSLREVAAAAGQRNHSAVQYHFGSRDKLVEAIFEARMGPIDARRNQVLADLDGAGLGSDTLSLVDVMVRPLAEYVLVEPPGWYGRFLAEISRNAPHLLGADRAVLDSLQRVSLRLLDLTVDVPPSLRGERLRTVLRATVQMLADHETSAPKGEGERRVIIAEMVDLTHAMLVVAPSAVLARELDAAHPVR
jgi:AcrR family transcriptional regulator